MIKLLEKNKQKFMVLPQKHSDLDVNITFDIIKPLKKGRFCFKKLSNFPSILSEPS